MKHLKAFDVNGKCVGTVMCKDEADGLVRARRRNAAVTAVGKPLPDVVVQGDVLVRQSEYSEGSARAAAAKVADPDALTAESAAAAKLVADAAAKKIK